MTKTPAIFMLTDFGTTDSYVGIMKAVISGIAPQSAVHDLNHHVRPQDVRHGAFELLISYPYLPSGAVVCAVVDPGVGSSRRAIACEVLTTAGKTLYFVLPDNGLLSYVLQDGRCKELVQSVALENKEYWFTTPSHVVSHTFHGRDIFSPVAAHIAAGVSFGELSSPLLKSELEWIDFPKVQENDGSFTAQIIHIDTFGNLITNLKGTSLTKAKENYQIQIADTLINGISNNFADVEVGEAVAYVGSSGFLEIAVRNGNAKKDIDSGSSLSPIIIKTKLKT